MVLDEEARSEERLYDKTFKRAINLLTYRARSVKEMRERLLEKVWAREVVVERVIARLLEYGYLNDAQFACDLALSRLRQKPVGRRVLQQKLALKKLDPQTVKDALDHSFSEMPEEQLIDRAIEKRIRLRGFPTSRECTKKLIDHLARQGFSYSLIAQKLAGIAAFDIARSASKQ